MRMIKKMWKYYQRHGIRLLFLKMLDQRKTPTVDYGAWIEKHNPDKIELRRQSQVVFEKKRTISIAVPIFHTPEAFLREMIESVQKQTYTDWELCIADGSKDRTAYNIVSEYAKKDNRIKVIFLNENKGISDNTNAALAICSGEYVGLLDHDDFLAPNALFEVRCAIEKKGPDIIYTDEDKVSADGRMFSEPHFKSDFNEELLRSNNYICHFFVVKKTLLDIVGGFRREYDGAQDYDFILRCTEKANRIEHIPKPLYHWRTHSESTAKNPESKKFAYEAGKQAIEEHIKRKGENGIVMYTEFPGFYHVQYNIGNEDKVLILIVNKNKRTDIKKCINSIKRTSGYSNYEIRVIDSLEKITTITISAEIILVVDSSIKMISKNWMQEMIGNCQRKQVGAVGVKIYNRNETVYHGGIVNGMNGYAFEGMPRVRAGYFHRDSIMQNMSGVTSSFMMFRVSVLKSVLQNCEQSIEDEIELNSQIIGLGKTIIYNPSVECYVDDSLQMQEKKQMKSEKDKYYNENLSLIAPGYILKD